MGKRSKFLRRKNDFYETPEKAVLPLLPHLKPQRKFIEPCAGHGALIKHIEKYDHKCIMASDINPAPKGIIWNGGIKDATKDNYLIRTPIDCFITNPPWTRELLHPIIENLSKQYPTWLLFDANWLFTKQAKPYLPYLLKVVTIGRIKWIEDSKYLSKDDCCWYLFDQQTIKSHPNDIEFIGKQ